MSRKLLQTKKTTLAYGINDSATTMRLTNLLKLDGTSVSASDIGDLLYGTFAPGTSREEIFSIVGSNVTVNSDGTVDIVSVVRGLKEVSPYNTGGFSADHGAGEIVIFGNNPQVYAQLAFLADANTFAAINEFSLLPTSSGGNATDNNQLITYAQALAMATGTTSINRVVVAGNAGETVIAGQLLYLDVADGEWKKCDADTAGSVNNIILGIAQGAGTDGVAITNGVLLFGLDSNQTGLTTNTAYYASNTAGGISTTPGTTEVSVGISRSTTSILFYPRYNQMLTEDQQDALAGNNGTPSGTNKFATQTGLQIGAELYGADAGANDTYVITLDPVPVAYVTGMVIRFKANTANTGAATINVNSLGAKTIVKYVSTTLADGDIAAGMYCTLIYDGTNFVLQNPIATVPASTPVFKTGQFSKDMSTSTTTTIAHGLGKTPKFFAISWFYTLANNSPSPVFGRGAYDGTNQNSAYSIFTTNGSVATVGSDSDSAVHYAYSGTSLDNGNNQGTVSWDDTNITITWNITNSPTGTAYFNWEAQA